ncbi:TPA: helix-turn-helix transcriptional regulator [Streptococcus suis]|nr:helix-turn-helix transcriptional regulator [Streptococcus suis]
MLKWSLKALRVNAGLTAKEVADMVGIHQQTLLKYERDSMDIRVDLLAQLAELYRVNQDDIFLGKQSVLKRNFKQNQPN